MGTPPALNALDQMRRMQISASGAGECAAKSSLETTNNSFVASREMIGATIAGRLAMFCGVELVFASGNTGGPVRLSDVSQQDLYLQHPIVHAFSAGAFVRMHGAAGSRTVPRKRALASTADMPILPSITLFQ